MIRLPRLLFISSFLHLAVIEMTDAEPYEPVLPSQLPSNTNGYQDSNENGSIPVTTRIARLPPKTTAHGRWRRYTKADGNSYYHRTQIDKRNPSYITELDMTNGQNVKTVDRFIQWVVGRAEFARYDLSDVEIVFDPADGRGRYYMASMTSQKIFAFQSVTLPFQREEELSEDEALLKTYLTIEYWNHIREFPMHERPPWVIDDTISLLGSLLLVATLEPKSEPNALFDLNDMKMSLDNLTSQRDMKRSERGKEHYMYLLADTMLAKERDQYRKLSTKDNERRARGPFFRLWMPLLLFQPLKFLNKLEKIHADGLVSSAELRELDMELDKEANKFITYATVLLAVDIAYLAVPALLVSTPSSSVTSSSATSSSAQTTLPSLLAQVSAIFCIGSVVLSLLRLDEYLEADAKGSTDGGVNGRPIFEIELEAVHYSLPSTLVMWGMLVFAASFLAICFESKSIVVEVTVQRAANGFACGIVFLAALFTLYVRIRLLRRNKDHDGDKSSQTSTSERDSLSVGNDYAVSAASLYKEDQTDP